jgi:transcriptional regulator with XRE-family HTH domain
VQEGLTNRRRTSGLSQATSFARDRSPHPVNGLEASKRILGLKSVGCGCHSAGLTITDLAAAAHISGGLVSKIENGGTSASLGTLSSIAKALHVPLSQVFAETEERHDCSFVKAGRGLRIERRGTKAGHLYDLLGHLLEGAIRVEPYLISLSRDVVSYTQFRHASIELIYMLSGRVRYRHGETVYLVEPGHSLLFDSGARHGPGELIEAPMRNLSVIIYGRR